LIVLELRVRPQSAAQNVIGQEQQANSDKQTSPAGATILARNDFGVQAAVFTAGSADAVLTALRASSSAGLIGGGI